jgi:hypothetical protein
MSGGPALNLECAGSPAIALVKAILPAEGMRPPEVLTTPINWVRPLLSRERGARTVYWVPPRDPDVPRPRFTAVQLWLSGLFVMCLALALWLWWPGEPGIAITEIPRYDEVGGRDSYARIAGKVSSVQPDFVNVLVYSLTDAWWIQPSASNPFTHADSRGRWRIDRIHAGRTYAACLVTRDFKPSPENPISSLPRGQPFVFACDVKEGRKQ